MRTIRRAHSTTYDPPVRRLPLVATVATDVLLLATLVTWQWSQRQPLISGHWRIPIILSLLTLGCGAVALIACRRSNRVVLFLCDFAAVLAAAWLFQHLYERSPLSLGQTLWLR